ncbi:Putative DNA segregation ATPase [Sodalis praecaptivus]|uniref:Putative DNA segregation ATPase n=1 Tax=Sodalis praecaptivus TaxID=1239307 RepID=W0HY84_9GAMM|nr:hypothetical protein [Sodalis praecaptivus]AHF78831.1 Putative DNA segregation ATPase [Sodalis praecaptivus]
MTCITSLHKPVHSAHNSVSCEANKTSPVINRHGTLFQPYWCGNNANAVLKTTIYRSTGTLNIIGSTPKGAGAAVNQDKALPLAKNALQYNSQPLAQTSPAVDRFKANTTASIEFAKTLLNTDDTPPPIKWSTHPLLNAVRHTPSSLANTATNEAGTPTQDERIPPQAKDLHQHQRLESKALLPITATGANTQQTRVNLTANIVKVTNVLMRLEENSKKLRAMQQQAVATSTTLQTLAEKNHATRAEFNQRIRSRDNNQHASRLTDGPQATPQGRFESTAMPSVSSALPLQPVNVKRKGARIVVPPAQPHQASLDPQTNASNTSSNNAARITRSPRKKPIVAESRLPNYMKPTQSTLAKRVKTPQQSKHSR